MNLLQKRSKFVLTSTPVNPPVRRAAEVVCIFNKEGIISKHHYNFDLRLICDLNFLLLPTGVVVAAFYLTVQQVFRLPPTGCLSCFVQNLGGLSSIQRILNST